MTKTSTKYTPTVHAIERFREYYNVKERYAIEFANEIMADAHFIMKQPDGRRIYQNDEYDTMVVLDAKIDRIITVNPSAVKRKEIEANTAPTVRMAIGNNAILAAAHATIKRELAKARRSFTREYRMLTEEIAVIGLEIAQLTLNKARARSPITQRHITDKVSEIHAVQTQLAAQRKQLETEYGVLKAEAQAFLGEAVTS